jgi:hypothetical protein
MKVLFILSLIFATLFILGCTQNMPICGDGVCASGEELTCPTDCAVKVDGKVFITINGAYDSDGEIYLYWYHSKDVYASLSQNLTSRLAENWEGSQNKNLFISFNDSSSGSIPVDKYGDRQIVLENLEQGEYYFEARTNDYAYRAVSEKVLIKENGDKYITLNLSVSNPAVRIKTYDEYGNILNGPGKITIYANESYTSDYGDYQEYEWEHSYQKFNSDEEMNLLSFLWQPDSLDKVKISYRAVVEKEGYEPAVIYLYDALYNKYLEYSAWLYTNKPAEKGDLKVQIVPGNNTDEIEAKGLIGVKAEVCSSDYYSECSFVIIDNDLSIILDDYPVGEYVIRAYSTDSNLMPVSIDSDSSKVSVKSKDNNSLTQIKAIRGMKMKMSLYDGNRMGDLADPNKVLIHEYCVFVDGVELECYKFDNNTPLSWTEVFGSNPYFWSRHFDSYNEIQDQLKQKIVFYLLYGEKKAILELVLRQGYPSPFVVFE